MTGEPYMKLIVFSHDMKAPHLLILILIVGFVVRLNHISAPLADWHSWRQADTAAVTRNFFRFGLDPLHPRYDDLSNVQSGQDNPMGYRMVEFPVYNILSYYSHLLLRPFVSSLETSHRVVSILSSVMSMYLLYLLGKRYANERVGLFAAFFFAVMPYSIYYSRVLLPEPLLVFFSIGMVWFYSQWIDTISKRKNQKEKIPIKNHTYLLFTILFGASALLIKPIAVFYLIPLVYLIFQQKMYSWRFVLLFLCSFVLLIIPFLLWRKWIQQFPEGVPAWQWLFNGKNLLLDKPWYSFESIERLIQFAFGYDPSGIRYRPAFFRWLLWERLVKLILGYGGILFIISGGIALLTKLTSKQLLFLIWGIAMVLYAVVFAQGNIQHDYYQVIMLPVIALWMGVGADYLFVRMQSVVPPVVTLAGIAAITYTMIWVSWEQVKGYYWINNPAIIEAGKAADRLLPPDAKVIAPYGGDTAFLYQTNRQGWPVGFEIEEKAKKGATHYVNINIDDGETKYVMEKFTVIEETDTYVIVELTNPTNYQSLRIYE